MTGNDKGRMLGAPMLDIQVSCFFPDGKIFFAQDIPNRAHISPRTWLLALIGITPATRREDITRFEKLNYIRRRRYTAGKMTEYPDTLEKLDAIK